jgi:DNA-binding protein H-NS
MDVDALYGERAGTKASDTQLAGIGQLISETAGLQSEIETLEQALKETKEREREYRHRRIPEAMLNAGMREFKTADGLTAKIVFITDGALGSPKTEEERREREEKLDCIIDNGGGEIVKQLVAIEFPKEAIGQAEEIKARLVKLFQTKKWGSLPVRIYTERSVNHQSLGKWIRERMEEDRMEDRLPQSFFDKVGIWYGEAAKLIWPKKPKGDK